MPHMYTTSRTGPGDLDTGMLALTFPSSAGECTCGLVRKYPQRSIVPLSVGLMELTPIGAEESIPAHSLQIL